MAAHAVALTWSRTVLRVARTANVVYGAAIAALLAASLVAPSWVFGALGVRSVDTAGRLILGLRAVMVVGIVGAVVAHVILTQLLAIVASVREGDPFVIGNARRLQAIAWWALAAEALHLLVGVIAGLASTPEQAVDLDWSVGVTPWIVVLMLFVLARVFEHGARMRADLEGTV